MNSQVRSAKANFIKSKLNEHLGDHKKCWQDIIDVIPDTNTTTNLSLCDNHTGDVNREEDTTNNNYFTNFSRSSAEKLKGDWVPKTLPRVSNFTLRKITLLEIVEMDGAIDISKSSAIPSLTLYILKIVLSAVPVWLLHIFDIYINQNVLPNSWEKQLFLYIRVEPRMMLAI